MWFKRKSSQKATAAPSPSKAFSPLKQETSGQSTSSADVRIDYTNANRSWGENFNLIEVAARAIEAHGHQIRRCADRLVHETSGLVMQPTLEGFEPLDRGGVRTVSIMRTHHPKTFPAGVFEFQHSAGDNAEDSLAKGFDQWAQVDLVVLLDSLREQPGTCMCMEMKFEAKDGMRARTRRAVLGPVAHLRQHAPTVPQSGEATEEQKHPFCPCCMLTRSFDAFKPLLDGDAFYAIRMFAMRDENVQTAADCRVNGTDWEEGKEALRKYVQTWPQACVEFRKQYVVLQAIPNRSPSEEHLA